MSDCRGEKEIDIGVFSFSVHVYADGGPRKIQPFQEIFRSAFQIFGKCHDEYVGRVGMRIDIRFQPPRLKEETSE